MDSEAGWDEGIDEEVQRLLRNERGQPDLLITAVHPPKSMPKLTSALLYQLPGGVTGASGKKLLRAKEVERRLNIARTELNKRDSEQRRSLQANADWGVAADGLNALKDNSFKLDKLKIPALQSLVRVLNVGKTTGLKKTDSATFSATVLVTSHPKSSRSSKPRCNAASLWLPCQPPPWLLS